MKFIHTLMWQNLKKTEIKKLHDLLGIIFFIVLFLFFSYLSIFFVHLERRQFFFMFGYL